MLETSGNLKLFSCVFAHILFFGLDSVAASRSSLPLCLTLSWTWHDYAQKGSERNCRENTQFANMDISELSMSDFRHFLTSCVCKHGREYKTHHIFPCVQWFRASPWQLPARSGAAKGSCISQASFASIRLSSRKITQQGVLLDMCIKQTVAVVGSHKDQQKLCLKL